MRKTTNRNKRILNGAIFDWIDLLFIVLGGFLMISIYYFFIFLTGIRIPAGSLGSDFGILLAPVLFAGPIIRRNRAARRGRPLPSVSAEKQGFSFLGLSMLFVMLGAIPFLLLSFFRLLSMLLGGDKEYIDETLQMFVLAAIAFMIGVVLDRASRAK